MGDKDKMDRRRNEMEKLLAIDISIQVPEVTLVLEVMC